MAALSASRQALQRRYDVLGQQVQREERQRTGQEQEALQRRFASMGALGSGASVRAEQTAQEEGAKRFGQAKLGIETARLGEEQRFAEVEEGRQYSTAERIAAQKYGSAERQASQKFASSEALKGRDFATSEREAAQIFTSKESGKAYTRQQKLLDKTQGFQAKENALNRDLTSRELDMNEWIATENLAIAKEALKAQNRGLLGGLWGDIFGSGTGGGKDMLGGAWGRLEQSGPVGAVSSWF